MSGKEYQLQHWNDDREPEIIAACAICIVAVVVAIAVRLYAQWTIKTIKHLDNPLIIIAAIFAIGTDAACIFSTQHGLGRHQLRVKAEDAHAPQETIDIFKGGWVVSVLQAPSIMFTKLCILYFYGRIFTTQKRAFKVSLLAVGTYTLALGVGSTVEFMVQCLPIQYFWYRSYALNGLKAPFPLEGWCMPQDLHLVLPLIANLISDVVIIALPVISLWDLQLPRTKKVGLFFTFSLGFFVCALEIVRIICCFKITHSGDATWENADSLLWSAVEVSMGVVCACIPGMAPLLRKAKRSMTPSGSRSLRQSRSHAYGRNTWSKAQSDNFHPELVSGGSESTTNLKSDAMTYCRSDVEGGDIPLHAIKGSKEMSVEITEL